MDALNFSRDCWDACGPGKGPWVQADLENGMFMTGTPTKTPESVTSLIGGSFESGDGFCCDATPRNLAMPYPFVTAMLDNPGSRTFTLRGGNATAGACDLLRRAHAAGKGLLTDAPGRRESSSARVATRAPPTASSSRAW